LPAAATARFVFGGNSGGWSGCLRDFSLLLFIAVVLSLTWLRTGIGGGTTEIVGGGGIRFADGFSLSWRLSFGSLTSVSRLTW